MISSSNQVIYCTKHPQWVNINKKVMLVTRYYDIHHNGRALLQYKHSFILSVIYAEFHERLFVLDVVVLSNMAPLGWCFQTF